MFELWIAKGPIKTATLLLASVMFINIYVSMDECYVWHVESIEGGNRLWFIHGIIIGIRFLDIPWLKLYDSFRGMARLKSWSGPKFECWNNKDNGCALKNSVYVYWGQEVFNNHVLM